MAKHSRVSSTLHTTLHHYLQTGGIPHTTLTGDAVSCDPSSPVSAEQSSLQTPSGSSACAHDLRQGIAILYTEAWKQVHLSAEF